MSDETFRLTDEIRLFLDNSRHGTALVRGTAIVYANPRICEYTGYSMDELVGKDFFDLTDEEHLRMVMEAAERVLRDPEYDEPIKVPIIRKDGEKRFLRINGSIVEWRGETLIQVNALDLTEQEEIMEKLRSAEQKYMAVLEHSPNNIYLVDAETMKIIESNSTLQDLLGYSAEELLEMRPYDFIDHDEEDVDHEVSKLPNEKYGFVGPRKYRTRDGRTIDVEVSANIIEYNGRKVISIVSWDVSDLKKTQEELMGLNEILRLIARITRHDIRNRLTIAYGILDLLVSGTSLDPVLIEEAHKSVRKSIDITKRMNELENLMVLGKERRVVDLREVIEDVIIDFPVKYRIDGDARIEVDSAFNSVIENLVGNAIFHGGADRINVGIIGNPDHVLLKISDNGSGVVDKLRDKIFEESFSYGENRGTGLGLYIVKKVIERYGGDVWVEDNIPTGATFVLKIPSGCCEMEADTSLLAEINDP